MKRVFRWIVVLAVSGSGALLFWDHHVAAVGKRLIRKSTAKLPRRECALLLGTNKYLARGKVNWYYRYRIEAAARLYRSGKVERILLSGDGRSRYYDEVKRMRRDLIRRGIPASALVSDPGGVRTLESIRRSAERFGCRRPIIVSQPFHLERALYIARALGMEALGYAAAAREDTPAALRMRIREILARGKMAWDLLLWKIGDLSSFKKEHTP
jgi:SanA protein